MSSLDLDFVRAQFPARCWEWAFFESAGGSFVPISVIDRITAYMRECQVQPAGAYPASVMATQRIDSGHRLMAAMIGAEKDEVVIAASTSINAYVLAHALRPLWRDGDEVIVATQNHEANAGPWRRLAESGIKVLDWPVHPLTGDLDPELLDDLLGERTRIVAFPHVSNIVGAINDVAAITKKVHHAGARVVVDGVAYAPHRLVDVKAWDVDFYLFSFYKVFGPHMGCLYGKRERLIEATPQSHYFFEPADTTHNLNPAGPNHESIAALAGIADYFDAVAEHHLDAPANDLLGRVGAVFELIAAHEQTLAERFADFAVGKPELRLIGPTVGDKTVRAPTFTFTVEGRASAEIPSLLLDDRVAVAHGNFYAPRLLSGLGVSDIEDGVVRVSMAHYNTLGEVDRLITALDRVI